MRKLTVSSKYFKMFLIIFSFFVFASPYLFNDIAKGEGRVDLSDGVDISTSPVVIGEEFTISFTLKEYEGDIKEFRYIAVAIHREDDSHVFDFAMFENVTIPPNGTWEKSVTNKIPLDKSPGNYKVIIKGQRPGKDEWIHFDGIDGGVNPKDFTAVEGSGNQEGWVSVSYNCVSKEPVFFNDNFGINVQLREVRGFAKTFEKIAIAILDANDNFIFDFAMYDNVTVPANGTWDQEAENQIYSAGRSPGEYKIMVRGKLPDDDWFDFDTTGSGVNPSVFTVVPTIHQDSDTGSAGFPFRQTGSGFTPNGNVTLGIRYPDGNIS